MYHDYFDDLDASGLRNPYAPETPGPEERGGQRQRLILLGMVGAGLSVVAPTIVRAADPTAEQAITFDMPTDHPFG